MKQTGKPHELIEQFKIWHEEAHNRSLERIWDINENNKVVRLYRGVWELVCDHDEIISFEEKRCCNKCVPKETKKKAEPKITYKNCPLRIIYANIDINDPVKRIAQFEQINLERKEHRHETRIYKADTSTNTVYRFKDNEWVIVCAHDQVESRKTCSICFPKPYIPPLYDASKISCHVIDLLEKELNISIQHVHYNYETLKTENKEHTISNTNYRADGFYVSEDGQKVAIEFFGDKVHGHPCLYNQKNFENGRFLYPSTLKKRFAKQQNRLQVIQQQGYKILYIWQQDFLQRNRD